MHADDPTEEQLQALDDAKETSYRIGGAFVSAVSKFVSAISPAISLPTPQDATAQCAYLAGRVITLATVRDRVREELLPWALGYSDPVRERVEGRQREAAE